MFNFHKPKVYRSVTGCCICKAKSSSSRFTDSKKYEEDFIDCFKLTEKRQGEVCNACVLLVKRWKKLPKGVHRDWNHVVDARAGPGTKSMTKFKSRAAACGAASIAVGSRKRKLRRSHEDDRPKKKPLGGVSGSSDESGGENSRSPSPSQDYDPEDDDLPFPPSGFIDLKIWKPEKICCGTVFRGPGGLLIIDPRFVKLPCERARKADPAPTAPAPTSAKTQFSDSSSDSGYDESSNPGPPPNPAPPMPIALPLPMPMPLPPVLIPVAPF